MGTIELRRPLLVAALILGGLAFAIELGMGAGIALAFGGMAPAFATSGNSQLSTPGIGIAYLGAIDFLLVYSLVLMTMSMIFSKEILGRIHGLVGIVVSLLGLLALAVMFGVALARLVLMVSLLLAPIFGTLAYFALFATFDRGTAAATLGLILMLKIALGTCLVFAHPRFLQNKSLVLLMLLSVGLTVLVSFLHGFPPGFLANIGDSIAALIIAIVAIVWLMVLLIGSVVAVVKAV